MKEVHTNERGILKNRYVYDAFGNIIECEELIENQFRFAGEQYDQITGQYYFCAKFYNPVR